MTAACDGMDTDIWFEQTPSYDPHYAKIICNGDKFRPACPIKAECLAYAIRTHTNEGIFGGLTPSQRKRIRSRGAA